MNQIRRLPIGTQDFETIRTENDVYVDKTQLIHQMITQGCMYYLTRPRRFGKSLLISTLKAIFQGKRHLFKDLWIDSSDYSWEEHPVILLDMSRVENSSPKLLQQSLREYLDEIAEQYGIRLSAPTVSDCLHELITDLAEKYNKRVVVLVDEYDTPLVEQIDHPEIATRNYEILRHFYVILKAQGANIDFVLMTGISKFSMASGFSGLNNLQDISLSTRYASLVGFTQQELTTYFSPEIDRFAEGKGLSRPALLDKIKDEYYGYQFSSEEIGVYNPFEILLLLESKMFSDFWFDTGNPRLLVDLIKEKKVEVSCLEDPKMQSRDLWMFEIDDISTNIESLLYQTGYLTIKSYDESMGFGYYTFGYPNREVKMCFLDSLLVGLSKEIEPALQSNAIFRMTEALGKQAFDDFFQWLEKHLARIPYEVVPYEIQMPIERYYQNIFYLVLTLVGLKLKAAIRTNQDSMWYQGCTLPISSIEVEDSVWIFGVSGIIPDTTVVKSAQKVLEQIKTQGYAEQFRSQQKAVYLIGVIFDPKKRNVSEYVVEVLA